MKICVLVCFMMWYLLSNLGKVSALENTSSAEILLYNARMYCPHVQPTGPVKLSAIQVKLQTIPIGL